jgi:hypothetical protein
VLLSINGGADEEPTRTAHRVVDLFPQRWGGQAHRQADRRGRREELATTALPRGGGETIEKEAEGDGARRAGRSSNFRRSQHIEPVNGLDHVGDPMRL